MAWLSENWFWILTFIAFIAMHLFGHGGHGGGDRKQGADGEEAGATQSRARQVWWPSALKD